jgi:hypothetical protein
MMVVTSLLPFILLFGAAIKLSAGPPVKGESRIRGGRPVLIIVALTGALATVASIVVAFVPPPEETQPALAVLKVAGTTAFLLALGALIYTRGARRRHA